MAEKSTSWSGAFGISAMPGIRCVAPLRGIKDRGVFDTGVKLFKLKQQTRSAAYNGWKRFIWPLVAGAHTIYAFCSRFRLRGYPMAYWITLKRGQESAGFSARTAEDAVRAVEAKQREGWTEVRVIDPDGVQVSAYVLAVSTDTAEARAIDLDLLADNVV